MRDRWTAAGAAMTAVFLLGIPALSAQVPTLKPGGEYPFAAPDADPEFFSELFFGASCTTLAGIPGGFSGSCIVGSLPLSRATCELVQFNDFQVSPGAIPGAVVMSHITGQVEANGFMLLSGTGQVEAKLVVQLIDLGDDLNSADDDSMLMTQTVAAHELLRGPELGVSVGGSVDVGSATALQGGVSLEVAVDTLSVTRTIRDSETFAFDAPLRRGHHYRLQVSGQSSLRLGRSAGLAKAAFHSVFNTPDNMFDPAQWLDTSNLPIKNWELPDLPLPFNNAFTLPKLSFDEDALYLGSPEYVLLPATSVKLPKPAGLDTTGELFAALGIPTSLQGLVDSEFVDLDIDLGPGEPILDAGVRFSGLKVSLAHDALERSLLDDIEVNLARRDRNEMLYRYQLPSEFGGYLEFARGIVADAIAAMSAAEQKTNDAQKYLNRGDAYTADGKYKQAYRSYRKAYHEVTQRG